MIWARGPSVASAGRCGRCQRRSRPWLKASLRPTNPPDGRRRRTTPSEGAGALPAGRVGEICPSVASLLANPSRAAEIPMHQIPAVVAELTSEQAALMAILGMLTTRLLVPQSLPIGEACDRLLTADEVAEALGVTRRSTRRLAKRRHADTSATPTPPLPADPLFAADRECRRQNFPRFGP